ncbi:MAG: Gldg family protein [Lachnospiraceae bacterium]
MKKFFGGKSNVFKRNTYSATTIVVVVAAVILFNMLFQQVVASKLQFDMTERNLYEISSVTERVVGDLEDTVTFTVLADQETSDDIIVEFIGRYSDLSSKIKVTWINPTDNPDVLDEYDTAGDTIVIACEATGKSTLVDFDDIISMDIVAYYTDGTQTTIFDGDGQLTSAVNLVTNMLEFKVYNVTGHGESTFSDTITDLMDKNGIVMEDLNLLTTTSVPEDCGLLIMNAPLSDLTVDEINVLTDYMSEESIGDIMIMLGDAGVEIPNLEAFLLTYGLQLEDGYIVDQTNNYQGNAYYIVPELSVTSTMADDIVTEAILVINTQGFTKVETENENISLTSFLMTSEDGVQIDGDVETAGQYTLAAHAVETFADEDAGTAEYARLTVYGSNSIINEQVIESFTTLENTTLFMNSVMRHFDGGYNVSIASKLLDEPYNTITNPANYSLLLIIVIPLGILVSGFIVWNKRRKK